MPVMLELREITKRFGDVLANDRVSLAVAPGTIHAVVGENGAGKSTAMRIAYGFYAADSGEVLVDGRPARLASPHDAIALGIGMVHQHFMLVETMTVAENIVLGHEPGSGAALDLRAAAARVRSLSQRFRPRDRSRRPRRRPPSVGQQQRVELLKALYRDGAAADPRRADLRQCSRRRPSRTSSAILGAMREQGKTVVIVTHKLSEVLAISDEVTVMRDGRVVGHRPTAGTSAVELARLMVGRDVLLRVVKPEARPGAAVLAVRDLALFSKRTSKKTRKGDAAGERRFDGVSFDVRAGEIVGIAAVEGNGQTELIEALAGLAGPGSLTGTVQLGGEDVTALSVRERRERGIAHVPEDRLRRGLLLDFDLAENAILGVDDRPPPVATSVRPARGSTARRSAGEAQKIVDAFDVRPADLDLSGPLALRRQPAEARPRP